MRDTPAAKETVLLMVNVFPGSSQLIKLVEFFKYRGEKEDKIISVNTLVCLSPIYFSEFHKIFINEQALLYNDDKKHCSFILQIFQYLSYARKFSRC